MLLLGEREGSCREHAPGLCRVGGGIKTYKTEQLAAGGRKSEYRVSATYRKRENADEI